MPVASAVDGDMMVTIMMSMDIVMAMFMGMFNVIILCVIGCRRCRRQRRRHGRRQERSRTSLLLLLLQVMKAVVVVVVITVKTIVSRVCTSASSDVMITILISTNINIATFTGTVVNVSVVKIFQHVGYVAHDDGAEHVEVRVGKVRGAVDERAKTEDERVRKGGDSQVSQLCPDDTCVGQIG